MTSGGAPRPTAGGFDPGRYWEARLQRDFSLHGVGYIGMGAAYNAFLYRARRRTFRRIVASLDADVSGWQVLDVGSGTGFYIERWREAGVSRAAGGGITGVDLTAVAVDGLRRRFPGEAFHQLDVATDAPLPPIGPFDAISIFDVLFHIVDDAAYRRAFVNLGRLLRPGGVLLFSENFLHGPAVRAPHVVSRSLGEIDAAASAAGLRIERRGPMFVLMNYPVDARGSLPARVWSLATLPIRASGPFRNILGGVAGALVYPLELALIRSVSEGPSTEFAIARRDR